MNRNGYEIVEGRKTLSWKYGSILLRAKGAGSPVNRQSARSKNPLVRLGGLTNPNLQGEPPTCWATKHDRLTDCIKYT